MHEPETDRAFPREEFGALLRRLPRYARLAWALAGDKRLSRVRRAALLAAAAYVASPIDLVPGFIPVVGQLDDFVVALTAIRLALAGLDAQVRGERLATAGLTQADLDADLRATGAVAAWVALTGWRVGRKVATTALRGASHAGRSLMAARRRNRQPQTG